VLPEQLLAQGFAVLNGLIGNANFTNVPVDLALLKTALDAYSVAIAEARDGSKKAIALRNRQGEEVIRMLRALAKQESHRVTQPAGGRSDPDVAGACQLRRAPLQG